MAPLLEGKLLLTFFWTSLVVSLLTPRCPSDGTSPPITFIPPTPLSQRRRRRRLPHLRHRCRPLTLRLTSVGCATLWLSTALIQRPLASLSPFGPDSFPIRWRRLNGWRISFHNHQSPFGANPTMRRLSESQRFMTFLKGAKCSLIYLRRWETRW